MPLSSPQADPQVSIKSQHVDITKQTVVVLGAGTMGRMIAMRYALAGAKVTVVDPSQQVLDSARRKHESTIRQAVIPDTTEEKVLGRISYVKGDINSDRIAREHLKKASLVVEAIIENLKLKRKIFKTLSQCCRPTTILATNSSSYSIEEITKGLSVKDKGRCCNTHYLQEGMAPVEVMRGQKTQEWAHRKIVSFLVASHQVPIQVLKENKGFVFNIIWRGIKKTCLDLIDRGVSTPAEIDRIWMMAFKTKIGPCGVMDMVGLDVVRDVEQSYFKVSQDPKDKAPQFLNLMVKQGFLGMKSGKGFYQYNDPCGFPVVPDYSHPGFLEAGMELRRVASIVPIRESLLGSWKLKSFTSEDEDGEVINHPMGKDAQGILSYNVDGTMSVALYQPHREAFKSTDPLAGTMAEKAAAFSSMFSYFGRFRVGKGCVSHDIEACSFPNWSKAKQLRFARFEGGELVLTTPPIIVQGRQGIQRLVWTRG